MTTKAKNEPLSKQAQIIGIILASLLALAAIMSALFAPTDMAGRPLERPVLTASN